MQKIFHFLFIFSKKFLNENSKIYSIEVLAWSLSNETKIVQIRWEMKFSWSKALKKQMRKIPLKEFWLEFWLQKPAKCSVHFTNFWYEFRHFVFRFLKNNRRFKLAKKKYLTDFKLHALLLLLLVFARNFKFGTYFVANSKNILKCLAINSGLSK